MEINVGKSYNWDPVLTFKHFTTSLNYIIYTAYSTKYAKIISANLYGNIDGKNEQFDVVQNFLCRNLCAECKY